MKIILRECILKKIEMFFLQYIEFSDSRIDEQTTQWPL